MLAAPRLRTPSTDNQSIQGDSEDGFAPLPVFGSLARTVVISGVAVAVCTVVNTGVSVAVSEAEGVSNSF
jgi:hypothetical protein